MKIIISFVISKPHHSSGRFTLKALVDELNNLTNFAAVMAGYASNCAEQELPLIIILFSLFILLCKAML